MTIEVKMVMGNLSMNDLTPVFIDDEGTWEAFVAENTPAENEVDIDGEPWSKKVLTREELEAWANYAWTDCKEVDRIADYYFVVGTKRVAFGSRDWKAFMQRVADLRQSEGPP